MARGNLFSFSLPWEEIEERCKEASANWRRAVGDANQTMPLPHDEGVLAALVYVHIVEGTKDLMEQRQVDTTLGIFIAGLVQVVLGDQKWKGSKRFGGMAK